MAHGFYQNVSLTNLSTSTLQPTHLQQVKHIHTKQLHLNGILADCLKNKPLFKTPISYQKQIIPFIFGRVSH